MSSDNNKLLTLVLILLITMAGLIYIWLNLENKNFLTSKLQPAKKYVIPKTFLSMPPEKPKEHKWLFFGDLMLDRDIGAKIQEHGLDFIFANLVKQDQSFFQDYELVAANLEGAVSTDGEHYAPGVPYDFAFSPKIIESLNQDYNFNFFTIANNHVTDQGSRGLEETRLNLEELGIDFVGCPDTEVEECSSKIINKEKYNLGMVGLSMVYHMLNTDAAVEQVQAMASSTDFVIVNIHWGVEYEHQFNKVQQNLAHSLIDAGADLIIGHHPHVVQGMEIYQDKAIFYSLGNFVFDQYFSADTQEELALKINYLPSGKASKNESLIIELIPLRSEASQIRLLDIDEKQTFLSNFFLWSQADEQYHDQIISGNISL